MVAQRGAVVPPTIPRGPFSSTAEQPAFNRLMEVRFLQGALRRFEFSYGGISSQMRGISCAV